MSSLSEVLARLMPGALAAMRLMSGGQGINGTVVLSPQAARHAIAEGEAAHDRIAVIASNVVSSPVGSCRAATLCSPRRKSPLDVRGAAPSRVASVARSKRVLAPMPRAVPQRAQK